MNGHPDLIMSTYEYYGPLLGGKPHGHGKYVFFSGSVYEGMIVYNMRNGQGIGMYRNGNKYIGHWKDDLRQGHGRMEYSSGDCYEGEWLYNRFHGNGIYSYKNGEKYVGDFKNGQRHGYGTFFHLDGAVESEVWINNHCQQKIDTCNDCRLLKRDECFGKAVICADFAPATPNANAGMPGTSRNNESVNNGQSYNWGKRR